MCFFVTSCLFAIILIVSTHITDELPTYCSTCQELTTYARQYLVQTRGPAQGVANNGSLLIGAPSPCSGSRSFCLASLLCLFIFDIFVIVLLPIPLAVLWYKAVCCTMSRNAVL